MARHTDPAAVNRRGLVARYARLTGMTHQAADRHTRDWNRSDLRGVVERLEEVKPYAGTRRRPNDRITALSGYVTMVDGVTR